MIFKIKLKKMRREFDKKYKEGFLEEKGGVNN
jgi:hypothetical protein